MTDTCDTPHDHMADIMGNNRREGRKGLGSAPNVGNGASGSQRQNAQIIDSLEEVR